MMHTSKASSSSPRIIYRYPPGNYTARVVVYLSVRLYNNMILCHYVLRKWYAGSKSVMGKKNQVLYSRRRRSS